MRKQNRVKITSLGRVVVIMVVLLLGVGNAAAQGGIRTDVPIRLYRCSLSSNRQTIEKGNVIDVYFIVENYRKQQSPTVEFNIVCPPKISILYGEGNHTISAMPYRNTQSVLYKLIINNDYCSPVVPIEVWMSNDSGVLSPCYQVDIRIGQKESFADITAIMQSSLINGNKLGDDDTVVVPTTDLYRVVASRLNVRQGPSSQSRIIGTLLNGDSVEVLGIENNWAEIEYNQKHAYIAAGYIEKMPVSMADTIADTSSQQEDSTIKPTIEPVVIEEKPKKIGGGTDMIASIAVGFSNLYSTEAYSYGSIGGFAEVGVRSKLGFLPQNMFVEATVGFALLGNSQYTFPGFSINVLPLEIGYKLFDLPFHTQIGASLILGGSNIYVNSGSFHRTYYANPTVNLVIKEAMELGNHWDFGLLYLHGLNNVCDNLPIGLRHSSIQLFATYKIKIK